MVALCCECEAGVTGEAIGRFTRLFEADSTTFEETVRVRPCKAGMLAADFTFTITRCYPTVTDEGRPEPAEQADAARELNIDTAIIYRALACCPDIRLVIRGVFVDASPEAGCSILTAEVTAEVSASDQPESP